MPDVLRKIKDRVGEQGLVWLLNLLVLALLGQSIASLTWKMMATSPQQQATTVSPTNNRLPPAQSASVLAQQIASKHLFGKANIVQGQAVNAPETKLNLKLSGVIASPSVENALAFIAPGKSAREKAYKVGDNLPGGAILKAISGDRVLLEYRGRMETLTLHRKILSDKQLGIHE